MYRLCPANMTKFYQPFDLVVSGYCKQFFKRKFKEWYSADQVKAQLDNGVDIDAVQVGLQLTKLKVKAKCHRSIPYKI